MAAFAPVLIEDLSQAFGKLYFTGISAFAYVFGDRNDAISEGDVPETECRYLTDPQGGTVGGGKLSFVLKVPGLKDQFHDVLF
jgi:hypothetical protein